MNRRRVTVGVAAAGVVAGAAGLGVLAMPAGAGPAPDLPAVSAESLVESVVTAKPAAFGGTVEVANDLGIPALPGMPQLSDGDSKVRMWTDGEGRFRMQLPAGSAERTVVDDGAQVWSWNSEDQTVTKLPHDAEDRRRVDEAGKSSDPVALSREVVSALQEFSEITVDGTARVANRPVYELVLTPKPAERTVLREVRVAVDAELRMPLRVALLTNGTAAPAAQIGFSELNVGPQDAGLFSFTPPAGAEVKEETAAEPTEQDKAKAEEALGQISQQVVGTGWDTVLVAKATPELLTQFEQSGQRPQTDRGPRRAEGDVPQGDIQEMIKQLGKPVSGDWGSGTLITSRVGGALIADDGRVALGAVPEQVLVEAIGQVK
ncbi:LolA family protein [Saccharothrix coeruleofusca]|uniref:Membrane protein n=1 Tax=Saccharothrix coeruleofusca TaxID=33919 RepID=A0A918AMT5_9PSEU|nr:sigma-E factor regulatory protein RseB domain-containing protein [Saccharothrix coeruleofusca]GGP60494.1 membrane protein [Saccharothrix coeruleofusca]